VTEGHQTEASYEEVKKGNSEKEEGSEEERIVKTRMKESVDQWSHH
jgi:hypothetical protein